MSILFIGTFRFQDILWHDDVSAYLVLYSVSDVTSFQYAARLLGDIRETLSRKTATILVGNKADIVRNRNITQSGKNSYVICFHSA